MNAVSPGVIVTPGYDTLGLPDEVREGFLANSASTAPLQRNGVSEDVAKVVAFLASDDSGFVTGSEIFVDGGIAQI